MQFESDELQFISHVEGRIVMADNKLVAFNKGEATAGVTRVAYNLNYNPFNSNLRIFGPRIFGEYNLWKGFSPRAELELMNTNLPQATRGVSSDPLEREWVWGAFVGLKKEYRIKRKYQRNSDGYDPAFTDNKRPYADVLNVRFGFEFPMKKKASVSDMQ